MKCWHIYYNIVIFLALKSFYNIFYSFGLNKNLYNNRMSHDCIFLDKNFSLI